MDKPFRCGGLYITNSFGVGILWVDTSEKPEKEKTNTFIKAIDNLTHDIPLKVQNSNYLLEH